MPGPTTTLFLPFSTILAFDCRPVLKGGCCKNSPSTWILSLNQVQKPLRITFPDTLTFIHTNNTHNTPQSQTKAQSKSILLQYSLYRKLLPNPNLWPRKRWTIKNYNRWSTPSSATPELATTRNKFAKFQNELTITLSDLLLRGYQICILINASIYLTEYFVEIAHEGHLGIVKTKQLLRHKVWFLNMNKLVPSNTAISGRYRIDF